jgi:hypothetical protein
MTPIERSAKLKVEADELIREIKLHELTKHIGKMTPTGSYFLDLMMYPDIDLYLPPATPRQLFEIITHLVENNPVTRINFLNRGQGPLKEGLYVKPVIAVGEWDRPWKIDIWSVNQSVIDEKNAELNSYKTKMTPDQRELILNYKYAMLTPEGRTPMFSGIYIYRAVIDLGLQTFPDITKYLRDHSILV